MKEFFRQHGLRILAVAAAVAVALSLLTYFSSTSSVLENIAGVLTYPFRAAATAVSDWAADKRQYYEDTTTLKEENAALKKEIADLRAQQRQAQADSEENKLLRELLKLQQQRRDFTFVSTAVLATARAAGRRRCLSTTAPIRTSPWATASSAPRAISSASFPRSASTGRQC